MPLTPYADVPWTRLFRKRMDIPWDVRSNVLIAVGKPYPDQFIFPQIGRDQTVFPYVCIPSAVFSSRYRF